MAIKQKELSPDEHRQRHIELHQALDELVADWIWHNLKTDVPPEEMKMLSNTTIMELMKWSHQQTIEPTNL